MLPQVSTATPSPELPPKDARMQDSVAIWKSLGPGNAADTPPPEEVNEEFFHNASGGVPPLEPVADSEPPLVAVIGVGYVGLHLVTVFAAKFDVLAYDVSEKRLCSLVDDLAPYPSITLTSNPADLRAATHFLVSVPTTLLPDKQIDTSFVRAALSTVGTYARPGATVVVESSVGVGMTRKLLGNLMRSRNLKAGMSPERVDPGRTDPPVSTIPKLVSGLDDITPGSLAAILALYTAAFTHVVPVSSPEVAEMTKLYENTQRMVCIAHANEMADACAAHAIDAWEVARAAATKPFGYMPYAPGLGVGGHCIPVNPYYLLADADMPLLRRATERMWARPARVGDEMMKALLQRRAAAGGSGRAVGGAGARWPQVLVVGVGFKQGQAVLSCSPGVALIRHLLQEWDVGVAYADPLVADEALPFVPRFDHEADWTPAVLEGFDLIVVAVRQPGLDFGVLERLGGGVEVRWFCQ